MRIALLLALPFLPGCISGLLYTHTWHPLTVNFDHTPVADAEIVVAESDVKDLAIPIPRIGGRAEFMWHSNAIGDIAEKKGLAEIYYADVERFSILFNIWSQETVHVYGKAKEQVAEPAKPPN